MERLMSKLNHETRHKARQTLIVFGTFVVLSLFFSSLGVLVLCTALALFNFFCRQQTTQLMLAVLSCPHASQ